MPRRAMVLPVGFSLLSVAMALLASAIGQYGNSPLFIAVIVVGAGACVASFVTTHKITRS